MPTISQLPVAQALTAADTIPISQSGSAHSVTLGVLLGSTQAAVIIDQGNLLGRTSLGPGGPEAVQIGNGLVLNATTLQAVPVDYTKLPVATILDPSNNAVITNGGTAAQLLPLADLRGLFSAGANVSISTGGTISASSTGGTTIAIAALPIATPAAPQDMIGISQSGTDHAISYTSLINGQTIDTGQPASAASDGDRFWVAQGSSTMVAQTFSAIWPWITTKLLSVKAPVVELTANTTLDGTVHNGRILVCSQPVTLTPIAANMGSGFQCEVINLSNGTVSLAGSVISSSGTASLQPGQAMTLRCITYTGGTIFHASMGDGATTPSLPGQISALAISASTNSSVTLTWLPPATGGTPASYIAQYRVTGTTAWTPSTAGRSGNSETINNLTAGTSYDFSVLAVNAAGLGPISAIVTVSTSAPAGAVTSIIWNVAPSGSYLHGAGVIGVNAHVTPATAAVQFGFSTSTTATPLSWTAGVIVNTDLWGAYVPTPSTAGQWYAWVDGTDGWGCPALC